MFILATVIAFGTALLWARMFLRRDKFRPEPLRLIASLFIAGCLVTLPAAYIEQQFHTKMFLLRGAVIAPAVEESLKLGAVFLICWWSRHFDQIADGAIYGISCALGFAAVENLLFGLLGGFGVLGARALVGPITHPLYTGVGGLFLARAKFERRPSLLFAGLGLATLLHAGWNLAPSLSKQTGNNAWVLLFVAILFSYAVLLRRFLRHLATPEMQRLRTALALGDVESSRLVTAEDDVAVS
jgi:RsiW-degrading membrane proteinase PrsW (M82 family)